MLILIACMLGVPVIGYAAGVEDIHYQVTGSASTSDPIGTVFFADGEIYPVSTWNDSVDNFAFEMEGNYAVVFFRNVGMNLEFDLEVQLLESVNIKGTGTEWVGVPVEENDLYSVVCFRIEMDADSITLMRPNLWMEGNTVLSVGIQMNESGDIIYFQTVVEVSVPSQQPASVAACAAMGPETNEAVNELRENYYRLKGANAEEISHTFSMESEILASELTIQEKSESLNAERPSGGISPYVVILPNPIEPADDPLIPYISDSIYRSGDFEKWYEGVASNNLQVYSYITYHFAGTENRETHIIILDWVKGGNTSTQSWNHQLAVYRQECVHYNVYTSELGFSSICTPQIKVRDVKVEIEAINSDSGFFWKFVRNAEMQDTVATKIIQCIITWIPRVSELASNYEIWTSEDEYGVRTWQQNREDQLDVYGYTVYKLSAQASELSVIDDLIYMEVWGIGVTGVRYGYDVTAVE